MLRVNESVPLPHTLRDNNWQCIEAAIGNWKETVNIIYIYYHNICVINTNFYISEMNTIKYIVWCCVIVMICLMSSCLAKNYIGNIYTVYTCM